MNKFLFLLFGIATCRLELIGPESLLQNYPNIIVPATTANFGNPHIKDTFKGFVAFLPQYENPCSGLNSRFNSSIVVFVNNEDCDYALATYNIQQTGAGGVIFESNKNDNEVECDFISLPPDWDKNIDIFAVIISKANGNIWKSYKDYEIIVKFNTEISVSNKLDIDIRLTGDHNIDAHFISEIYKYMIPLPIHQANIRVFFNYFTCQNCSPENCYGNGKYCLSDSTHVSTGRNMINQTVFELILFNYVMKKKIYWGDFFVYLNAVASNCKADYSDSCSSSILEWLDANAAKIRSLVDDSWRKGNHQSNNMIDSELSGSSTHKFQFAPSISINSIQFLGNISYFGDLFCGSFKSSRPLSCTNACSYLCNLSDINNGKCDKKCNIGMCANDAEDCRGNSPPLACTPKMLKNSVCDPSCNYTEFDYDRWSCVCKCDKSLLTNGKCDPECNKEICNYDNGDCNISKKCKCSDELLYNNECDKKCDNPECNFDNWACHGKGDPGIPNGPVVPGGPGNHGDHGGPHKRDNDDSSITASQIALIASIIGGLIFLCIIGIAILIIMYCRACDRTREATHLEAGPRGNPLTLNETMILQSAAHQQHAQHLPSRINLQQEIDNQNPEIINSDENIIEDSEPCNSIDSKDKEGSVVEHGQGFDFYGEPMCTICLEKVTQSRKEITVCYHIFHKDCLNDWTKKKSKHALCPNCYAIIT
ncbi:unnamed protein product [Blepharisma stoltei]|uniref:RING-type domain-containing protein n=1 Tax=Blepharisma stoltei TaxID=1481888 RepID=A0AAU9K9N9_9CILI|nr:unnamed protein product [Blepharisma stoltei]